MMRGGQTEKRRQARPLRVLVETVTRAGRRLAVNH